MAGVVSVGCCCLRLAERLTEACGPGMPGPYGELKEIGAASRDRNPSGAAAPPPFDKGGRGSGGVKTPPCDVNPVNMQCKSNKNNRLLSRQQKSPVRFGILIA